MFSCVLSYAQENFTGINDSTINLSCNETCTGLKFRVPHLKSSEDYTVTAIPFRPYAFTTPTGNALNLYQDDVYTDVIDLPFPVCFYGAALYNRVLVGSNGVLTFDISNANCFNAWRIDLPIPSAGNGEPCPGGNSGDKQSSYYPRAAIMGPMIDLDPTVKTVGQKIEWRVEGTAPFRRFVASWNNIAVWGNIVCSQSSPSTFQIVIHEGTSVVEVYIARQSCVPGTGSTPNAILGIQNWDRTKAVTVPGRNATSWTAEKEAYRFVPSGATSRFVSSELLDMNGTVLDIASSSAASPGFIDIQFNNRCFTGAEQFIVRTTYTGECDTNTPIVIMDTITVNAGVLPLTYATVNSGCAVGTGSIQAEITSGSGISGPYTFTLNPGAHVITTSNTVANFADLAPGHYSLTAVGSGGCSITVPDIEIISTGTFDVPFTVNPPSCQGANNASITLSPPVGGGPYSYTINGSPQPGNIITDLPGGWPYTVEVSVSPTCSASVAISIPTGTGTLTAMATTSATSCAGRNDGQIIVTATSGSGPYEYSLDGTNWQTSNIFSNLAANNYTVFAKEGLCISDPVVVTVAQGAGLIMTSANTPATCHGVNNGTVTIQMQNGTAPYTIYLTPAISLTTTTNTATFTNVAPGTYSVQAIDAGGCSSNTGLSVTVAAGNGITASTTITDVSCFGQSNGSILVTPAGGNGPYSFSLNGGAMQTTTSNFTFSGLAASNNAVEVVDAVGCSVYLTDLIITQPAQLSIPQPSAQPPLCNGDANGIITVSPTGGTTPYTYSLNGAGFQPSNTFKVASGTYVVRVLDARNCTAQSDNVIVTEPLPLTATVSLVTPASCDGGADGTITVSVTGGTGAYQYSTDGTKFQASNVLNVLAGTHTVTVKDASGCLAVIPDIIVGLHNNLVFTPAADPAPICEGTGITLQAISNATEYSWAADIPGFISDANVANPTVKPTATTVYTVSMRLGVCMAADEIRVQVRPAPVPDAGPDGEICYGQNYQLQAQGGVSYEWTPQRFLSDPFNPNPQVLQPDRTMTYSLTVIDAASCRSLVPDEVTITVAPPIKVQVTPHDTVVYAGAQFQMLASSIGTNYTWSPNTGLNNPLIANPTVTAPSFDGATVLYKVAVTTDAGCKGEGSATVKVFKGPEIHVANAFSPNNDGKNDLFLPFPVGIKQLGYFKVFNRWGQLMFATTTLQHGWDGKLSGMDQPPGVYTWMIEAITQDGRKISKKGTVVLMR